MAAQRTLFALVLIFAACDASPPPPRPTDASRTDVGKADRFGSCLPGSEQALLCGGAGTGSCWCDERCHAYGDCCSDKTEVCGGGPSSCEPGEICASPLDAPVAWAVSTGWTQLDAVELDCGLAVVGHVTDGDFEGVRIWLLDPEGGVLAETDLAEARAATPRIAASAEGIAVTWSEPDQTVHARVLDADLSNPRRFDVSSRPGVNPAVAAAAGSAAENFVVVYLAQTAAGGYAFESRLLGADGQLGEPREVGVASGLLTSGCYTSGDVATGPSGTIAAWTHCESGRRALYVRPLDPQGAPAGSVRRVEEASDAAYSSPYGADLAVVPGGFAVGYSIDRDPTTSQNTLRIATVDPRGDVVAGPTSFSAAFPGERHYQPRLAAAGGSVAVAYYSVDGPIGSYTFDSWLTTVDPSTAAATGGAHHLWPGRDGSPVPFTMSKGFGALWPQGGALQIARAGCE